jgi:lipid A 4'-phosphatase
METEHSPAAGFTRLATLKRCRTSLACFLTASLLLAAFPGIDLFISKVFFDGSFHLGNQWWLKLLQRGLPYFLALSMAMAVGVGLFNLWTKRDLGGIDGRKILYLFAVLALGAGLIVNVGLKDHLGRARPRDIAEFGGPRQFTPAFIISQECTRNCSFPSGDAAAAFFSLALVRAVGGRRALHAAGIGLGVVVSLSRVAVGAHFFSDVLVSYFVMSILVDVLYLWIVSTEADRVDVKVIQVRPGVS